MGRRSVLGRRAVLTEVDFHDLHDAPVARFWPAHEQPAGAPGLRAVAGRDGGINYGWRGRSETCITGMVLSILSCFEHADERLDTLADYLLGEQMSDGGWSCRRDYGATHSSVHTTISVLEGLRLYELHRGRSTRSPPAIRADGGESPT